MQQGKRQTVLDFKIIGTLAELEYPAKTQSSQSRRMHYNVYRDTERQVSGKFISSNGPATLL